MLFIHTIDKVLAGTKTQTRRLVVPRTIQPTQYDIKTNTYYPVDYGETDGDWFYKDAVFHAKPCERGKGFWGLNYTQAKVKYRIGSTYAVQPGRGKKSVGRIQITGIRKEDVRNISREDVAAEGYGNRHDFFETWIGMHDPKILRQFLDETDFIFNTEARLLSTRPAERYTAWVLEFRLVEAETAA